MNTSISIIECVLFTYRYLRDNQVYGDSTPETYIHALKTGCRAVECKQLIFCLQGKKSCF